ncbi:hypothetical protein P12x_003536 [Tundrisphaera lichenicola]|uniref:hypothetical protein n=1 Tax=Tundrisphaera lichenicola TaxID=2029860 RepID=UPI003EBA1A4A
MSLSFTSLVRLIGMLAIATTILAVGVSRLESPKATQREMSVPNLMNINEYFLGFKDRKTRWLDTESGAISVVLLEGDDLFEGASCSPWTDENGGRQIVGRWTSRTAQGAGSMSCDFGLARYSFPGGKLLDQVSTDVVPVGPPCWYPGTHARILFEAGDGRLYRYAFESEPGLRGGQGHALGLGDSRPTPLSWLCEKPGQADVFMSDLSWPRDSRLEGRLVVSMRVQIEGADGKLNYTRNRLWWIRLDRTGTEIVEAGPLTLHEEEVGDAGEYEERGGSISTLPDGRLVLAYLRKDVIKKEGWELRVIPIRFDEDGHTPGALPADARILASSCQSFHPSFSLDGRWISVLVGRGPELSRVARVPIDESLLASARP